MKILKSIWTWLKANWLSVLAVLGVVFLLVYGYKAMNSISSLFSNDTSITEMLEQQEKRHIEELAELNKISNEQIKKQAELNAHYEQSMTDLRIEFQTGLDEIRKSRRRRQTQLTNDPTELGSAIGNVFGIPNGSN